MGGRLHVIDAIRGFCLVNILVNHLSAGLLTRASLSNLGLSDSADIFVLLAGVSTYLATGHATFREAAIRLWKRALAIYAANLILIATGLGALVGLAAYVGVGSLLDGKVLVGLGSVNPLAAAWHLLTFQQSVGYSLVLRLYVALMMMAPVLLWLSSRRWWSALPVAAVVWAVAGHYELVVPDSLTGAPLPLTILPWVLIFTCGVAIGAAYRQGVRLQASRWSVVAALALIIGYVVFLAMARDWPQAQAWLTERNEHFWLGGSKSLQSPLRVLHVLALVYLFVALPRAPVLRLIHQVSERNFFVKLGRQSLPVFVFGAAYALLANELLNLAILRWGAAWPTALFLEVAMIGVGVWGMFAVARVWEVRVRTKRSTNDSVGATAARTAEAPGPA